MFIFKRPPKLIRTRRQIVRITESLQSGVVNETNNEANAIVLDARSAKTLSDLTWLYKSAKKHSESAAFRKPGGRVVILRASVKNIREPEKAAVSESIVGFAKSLAKENGGRGATVNLLCDETNRDDSLSGHDACEAPLEWLLSHGSCYVTGQEMTVTAQPSLDRNAESSAILITGAAGAIGRATAEFLDSSEEESRLLLVDHPSTESVLDRIRNSLSDKVDVVPLDLTQSDAGGVLVEEGKRLGGWERIIHAAGITRDKTLRNMDYDSSWWPVLRINLEAAINIDQSLLSSPEALARGGGSSFVYFSSTSGIAGNTGQSNYAASKSGLLGYAVAMGANYPNHSFRVVSPGFIATDMTAKMPFLIRMIASRLNALGQAGKPEDIAAAVSFLSSRDASVLAPGTNLRVCGLFMGGR